MPSHGPRTTMREHVETYLDRLKGRASPSLYKNQRTALMRFATWWDATRKVPKSLREQDVERFVWGRHECLPGCHARVHRGPGLVATYNRASLQKVVGDLRAFLLWAARYRLVAPEVVEPIASHRMPRVRRERRLQLTACQLRDLLEGCDDPWERIICALAVHTAGRSGELLTLRLGDVDLDDGNILWARHKTGQHDLLPITSDLEAEIRRWLKEYERLCGTLLDHWHVIPFRERHNGLPIPWVYTPTRPRATGAWSVVKKHIARVLDVPIADLLGEGVHTVRRSVARALYEQLCEDRHPDPIAVVQSLLGHSTRAMSERYIGVESGRRERDRVLRGRSVLGRA